MPTTPTHHTYTITLPSEIAERIESNCRYRADRPDRPEDVIAFLAEVGLSVLQREAVEKAREETSLCLPS